MNDEASPEPMHASPTTDADNTGPGAGDTPEAVPDAPSGNAVVRYRDQTPLEQRLRRLAGRKAAYRGPIVATTRGWVSRDSRHPVFAARFLDFAVLTDEHLVLCSTGFFSRRPRRQVLREPLTRLGRHTDRRRTDPHTAHRRATSAARSGSSCAATTNRSRSRGEFIARTPADPLRRAEPWATTGQLGIAPSLTEKAPAELPAGPPDDAPVEAE